MNTPIGTVPKSFLIAMVGGCSSAVLGLSVLIGWYTHNVALIQVSSAFVPMQYNTALAFLICGVGILITARPSGVPGMSCGIFVALLGLLTLSEYIGGIDFGIDQLMMKHDITAQTSHPGRMAPNTALCFSLTGAALALLGTTAKVWRPSMIAGVLGSMTFGLGVVALTGYAVSFEAAYGWGGWTRMAVHTSGGLVVLGGAVSSLAWGRSASGSSHLPSGFPAIVGIGTATIMISLWQALNTHETRLVEKYGIAESHPFVNHSLLAVGLVLAAALSVAVYLARAARNREREVKVSNRRLATEIEDRKRAEKRLQESEERFRGLFDNSDVSVWNEDLTKVRKALDKLRSDGVTDLRRYLETNEQAVRDMAAMVKVLHVNDATLRLFGAKSEDEILETIDTTFGTGADRVYIDELCAIWDKQRHFRSEACFRSLDGRNISAIISFRIPESEAGFHSIPVSIVDITERRRAEEALREIASGLSAISGEKFFEALVLHLSKSLDADIVSVGIFQSGRTKDIRTAAYLKDFKIEENFDYELAGTPCEHVIVEQRACVYPSDVQQRFPDDRWLVDVGVQAYAGIPLVDSDGRTFGLLDVMFRRPLEAIQFTESMLTIFAVRAAAELERMQTEEALRESQERLSLIYDSVGDVLYFLAVEPDDCFRFVSINQAFLDVTGLTEEQIVGNRIEEVIAEPSVWKVRDSYKKAIEENRLVRWEETTEYPSGVKVGDVSVAPIFDHHGTCTHLVGSVHDITDRLQAEEALHESEKRMELALQGADLGTWDWNFETGVVTLNERWAAILGCTLDEIESDWDTWAKRIHPDDWVRVIEAMTAHLKGKSESYETEYRLRHESGDWVWVLDKGSVIERGAGGRALRACGTYLDITARKRFEAENERLKLGIEHAAESIVVTDDKGTFQYVNPAFEETTGYTREEVMGQNPRILKSGKHDETFYKALWDTLLRGETWRGQFTNRSKDGSTYISDANISPVLDTSRTTVNYISVQRNITHERELERQLLQAQKMESIGTLAGGIAHDFNNILQAILGFCSVAREQENGNDEVLTQCLQEIQAGGRRAADLVDQILTFSRKTEVELKPTTLQPLIEEALRFLRSTMPSTIQIQSRLDPDCGQVSANATQIHQAVTNLCTNAMHAMEEKGGVLTVSLGPISIGSSSKTLSGPLEPGEYVQLSVVDTGTGIDSEILQRLLDPFFTTKEVGKGTGLGLAMVHGIVKGMGGGLNIESEVGKGTAVQLMLPVLQGRQGHERREESVPLDGRGRGHVLIVDDEESVTRITTLMLKSRGFTVDAFNDVVSALEAFDAHSEHYDVAILDYTMPGKTGLELARDLHALNPEMPVVIATGILENSKLDQSGNSGLTEIIKKPFDVDVLVAAINRSL